MIENIKKSANIITTNWSLLITLLISSFIIAVSSQISIPLPNGVPMTLQTFSVALIGFCLYKNNKGVKSIIAYLFLGMIGMPIFAQGKGGISSLFGLTGGFLLGFIFLAYFCQKAITYKPFWCKVLFAMLGLLSCHFFGVLQYSILTHMNFINAALLVSIPFLLKDSLSVLVALLISTRIQLIKKNN